MPKKRKKHRDKAKAPVYFAVYPEALVSCVIRLLLLLWLGQFFM
ncbi:hypothetical protein DFR70_110245 [Nocardia tenerifensis]|uniref:Uncharacterized protein n=1 Tax=Nocardia tenerifensis TaxID=228006 RepID=A0A318K8M3_9NOCA|nr:hypothetical protein DFR70_110245 [Nocardia tenerifensis]